MSIVNDRKCTRASSATLKEIAAEGVGRAMAARKAAGIEVSPEQLDQIGGGMLSPIVSSVGSVFTPATSLGGIVILAGGIFYPRDIFKDIFTPV